MKQILKNAVLFVSLILSVVLVSSCVGEDGKKAKATFRKANLAGASMLALAQGSAATRAEGGS